MILRSHIINKNIFSLLLSLFFTCGIFISCENALSSFDDSHNQKEETSGAVQTINISGYYSAEGALPKVLTQESRSAFPIPGSTSNTPVDYYAIATNVNDTTDVIEGDVDTDGQTFVITGIRLDVTWEIEVGVKVNGIRCLYDTALPKKFTAEDASLMQNFFLKPVLSGNGSVNLDMAVDTSITDISVNLENSTQHSKWLAALEATAGDAKEISKNKIKLSNLPAGVYDLQIIFYQGSGDNTRIAYSTKQSINVITGMTTESWRSDGTDLISNTGVFNLTSTLINSYLDSVIYVGDAHRTATNHVKEANNANDGRAFSPLETLDEALNRIEAAGISRDYTIYVSGELSCNAEIKNTITTSNARSITISGLRGLTNGVPQDSLNGGHSGSVLKVNSTVPVTITYLTLTNGYTENGGGIYMSNGAQVTLSNGALVNQNSSSGDGGGIYCSGSSLTLEGSAKVSYNEGVGSGGGIALSGASLTVKDNASINNNKANGAGWGGGVCANGAGSSIEISGNPVFANNEGTEGGAIGAVDCSGGVSISGGSFSFNSGSQGAGIRLWSTPLTITGGRFENNSASSEGGAICCKGTSVTNLISGSVYIPYGVTVDGNLQKGAGKNDVFLDAGMKLTIDGDLTPPATANGVTATLAPSALVRGRTLIARSASSGITDITAYKDSFALPDADWNFTPDSAKENLYINSPIFVDKSLSDPDQQDGTRTKPFDSILSACDIITDSSVDYTIIVNSDLTASAIPGTISAASLLIKGAEMQSEHPTEPKFTIYGTLPGVPLESNCALSIFTSVPVTLEALTITRGNPDGNGGGIYLVNTTNLTLSDGLRVTGNKASQNGGGIYVPSNATLNVKGNVKVWGNTDASEPANPSNIYLSNGKVINVTGPLASGSELHVTTETPPSPGNPVTITQDYIAANTVAPYTYFFGDNGTALWNDDNTEACLKVGGGSIDVNPVYKDITISINITSFEKAVENKTITIKAVDNETGEEIEEGSDTGKIKYSYKLFYHGEEVPVSYYQTNSKNFTLGNNLPIGNYILNVNGIYDGKKYSANFEVRIIKDATIETDVSHAVEIISQIESTITVIVTGEMNEEVLTEMSTAIKNLSTEEANVKLDLSAVTGLTTLPFNMFKDCMHLEECHLPEGITTIESQAFWLCENLKSITLPSTLTSIQGSAFYRVPADIILAADGPGFKTVGDAIYTNDGKELVFYCNKQEENSSFVVPASVEKIRDYAFCSSGIKNLTFESGSHLTEIGSTVFDCCSNLEEIIIPDSVTTIGSDAFYACSSLANVQLPSELTEVNRLFGGCPMESIVIPDKVTSIKYASFWGDSTLREITLPASLTEIVSGAFGYCSGIETVKYKGSAEQKAAMTIGDNNGTLTSAEWILNYTGD